MASDEKPVAMAMLYVLAAVLVAALTVALVLHLVWPLVIDAVDKFVGFMLCLLIYGIG